MTVKQLQPNSLWNHFADLNAVPRPSKKEERVIQFMVDFGKNLGLSTEVDKIGNVIIKKPGANGLENAGPVIMQSHLDMVHQKNNDTVFDFDKQGIDMIVDGDWVKANGTTLGADNGIGVAAIMALLSSKDIAHPPIEAMFTIDEETGMTGAMQLDPSYYTGKTLLNLDTEDDDELSIGCAGGIDTNTSYDYKSEELNGEHVGYKLTVKGLLGGHSGMDIDKGHGNANKILTRILYTLQPKVDLNLFEFDGGSLRNAIPREAVATIAVLKDDITAFETELANITKTLKVEFQTVEKNLVVVFESMALPSNVAMSHSDLKKILNVLYAVPNGVFRMSPDIEGLVETSSSLARVVVKEGQFITQSLQRSSVESTKDDVANTIRASFENMGAIVVQSGDYPGWQPNPNSKVLTMMADLYREKYNEEPQIKACHAGLECGILGKHLPGVDMISFGPNIRGAHSPDEKVQISSVQKFWDYLLVALTRLN
jgi:dipeptidase D|tara:strand:- start:22418 stop:23869 length:1452 start_codon:yes stop_codon:yes gene_type:complete